MATVKELKETIVGDYKTHSTDTGSSQVQIALLSQRITELTEHFKVHVKQQPGFNYPKPVNKVHIREQNIHAAYQFGQPHYDKHERIPGGGPGNGGYYNQAGEWCPQ